MPPRHRRRPRPPSSTKRIPTTVVYGAEDWSTEAERKDEVETFVKGATLVTIPRAGHFTTLDRPTELVATVLKAQAQP